MILPSTVSVLWQQLELAAECESDLQDSVDRGMNWLVDFNVRKTQLVLFDQSNNTGAIDVKMDGSMFEEKSSFKMLGLCFPSKLDWGSYIISITKNSYNKIRASIYSMKFLSPEVVLYLYKSAIQLLWSTVVMLLAIDMLLLLNPWLIAEM